MDANNSFQHTDQGTVCMTDSVIDQAWFLNQLSSQTPCHFYISVYNSDTFLEKGNFQFGKCKLLEDLTVYNFFHSFNLKPKK